MKSWYEHSKDVQQKIHRDYAVFVSNEDMVHLTALVITIQISIQSKVDDKKTIFSRLYITHLEKCLRELAQKHNWKLCAQERIRLKKLEQQTLQTPPPPNETPPTETKHAPVLVEVDDCEHCYEFDSHVQLLRMSRLRYQLFSACHVPSTQPRRNLLYDMTALFVMLRRESRCDAKDTDIYLFFQVVYALTRLHHANYIFLTNATKNRYFTVWLMFFVEYSLDSLFYWEDYFKIVPFLPIATSTETQQKMQLQHAFRLLTSFLFVRRQPIPDSCLHVTKNPESWDVFVDQINQFTEVVNLRKAFSHNASLFTLDIRRAIVESDVI